MEGGEGTTSFWQCVVLWVRFGRGVLSAGAGRWERHAGGSAGACWLLLLAFDTGFSVSLQMFLVTAPPPALLGQEEGPHLYPSM